MNKHYLAACLVTVAWSSPAVADSFTFDFSEVGSDPAANFEEECLADDLDEQAQMACDARAAVMEAELVSHLISLEGDDAPESVALFQEALALDSPAVQAIAVHYLARTDNAPSGFLEQVKTFFFGTEPQLAATAANVLADAADAANAGAGELAELFKEQRSSVDYGPLYAGDDTRMATACLADARLNLVSSFTTEEQFAPAERLLMYDRFASDFTGEAVDYPVTAFVTDASLADVTRHFTKVFGNSPHPSAVEAQAELNVITEQMVALQLDALNGDQAAIAKMQELGDQMAEHQEVVTAASRLQLMAYRAENDVFWFEGESDDVLGPLPRAVTVGNDERLGRVVIRYLNGVSGDGADSGGDAGAESPDGGSDGDEPNGGDDPKDDEPAPSKGDSGCSAAGPVSSSPAAAALLALALFGLARRRRAR